MKSKTILTILLTSLIFLTNVTINGNAQEELPKYEITEDYVIIESFQYEITNNTILYNGKTYEIIDYTLVSHDENGNPIVMILPIEQNKITDQNTISHLNEMLEERMSIERKLPPNPEELPYTQNVPEGEWFIQTPFFNLITGYFYNFTNLKLTNFSTYANREFSVEFAYINSLGEWYNWARENEYDFGNINNVKIANLSDMRYGVFFLGNLYGDPSPSYTYRISVSVL